MRRRLSAAFVVTVSMGALGCHKTQGGTSSCEPPDCHANPPPQPTPTIAINPPPTDFDAAPPPDVPTRTQNPPAVRPDAGPFRIIGNPPPIRDGGLGL